MGLLLTMKNQTAYGPQFTASKFEMLLLRQIAQRAVNLAIELRVDYQFQDAWMDLEACHCNGMEMNLQKLLDAPDADFGHDVFGIRRYIDRNSGKITNCFMPRCAMPETAQTYCSP